MPDYNARIELDLRVPTNPDAAGDQADKLMDHLEDYSGTVARTPQGRFELIYTLPADSIRQAVSTALAIAETTGAPIYVIEVLPAKEFHERVDTAAMPELVSVPQAAELLGVSRQRALQLASGGQLDAVKVGDAWVIPRRAVDARAAGRPDPAEVVTYP